MNSHVNPLEWSLITGKWIEDPTSTLPQELIQQSKLVSTTDIVSVLTSESSKALLTVADQDALLPILLENLPVLKNPLKGYEDELNRLLIAISALHAFVQVNWTGPDLEITPTTVISSKEGSSTINEEKLNRISIANLSYGGEPAYHLAKGAAFLQLARLIFDLPFQEIRTIMWWRLRVTMVHQETLDEPVPPGDPFFQSLEEFTATIPPNEVDLIGRFFIEKGLIHHLLSQDKAAADCFVRAAKGMGLQYDLTGILGRRTKFQTTDLTQLVVLAESRGRDDDISNIQHANSKSPDESNALPEGIALNDDTLLEKTEYTTSQQNGTGSLAHLDPNSQPALHPLDQCVLLGLCLHVKNTSPSHGLTAEQMSPYVSRVISHPRNWSIHTMALLLRSRLEANRTRTIERSTLQLQALVDQMPTADSTVQERLLYFHQISLPSKWDLEKELALRFSSLGVLKSALEIFERLEMWEEVVQCWQAMERPDRGKEIVRDLLEGRKEEADVVLVRGKQVKAEVWQKLDIAREAKLWCLLGELEPDSAESHYRKAWDVSGGTSGRAMRSLGGYCFSRGQYSQAIECLNRAVAINPLLSRSWFILGCALVREESWKEARDAFAKCVSLDDEDAESWNNLASVYLRLEERKDREDEDISVDERVPRVSYENKTLAFRALQQGIKRNYSNWRMWANYMVVSVDVGELAEACRALGRVVEERAEKDGAESVDIEVLERLVNAVTRSTEESTSESTDPNSGEGLYTRVDTLFTRIILPRVSSSPRIWKARAQLMTWKKRWSDALDAYIAGYRCGVALDQSVETDIIRWREAVGEVSDLVDIFRNFGPKVAEEKEKNEDGRKSRDGSWTFQARSVLRTFMGRTKESFEEEPEWEQLSELLKELKNPL